MGRDHATTILSRAPSLVALAIGTLVPAAAAAGDGLRVRTPVVWSDAPCMTVVDRSVDAVVHLPYAIPFEDTERTADEVADGRTHQLFGFCRARDPSDVLPTWISEADVAAAEALALIDLGTVTGAAILDLDPDWQGCFARITPDAERRPITFAAAAEGVDWDTSAVQAGAWVVEGFTHDPAFSIWSARPGVLAVVDDAALDASGPAAAVLNPEEVVRSGEPVAIEGCVRAMEGSALTLSWAKLGQDAWQPAVQDEPVRAEGFAIDLVLPPEMAGQAARVRVEAVDPQGRSTTAFMRHLVIVLAPPPDCGVDACGTTTGSDASSDGDTTGLGGLDDTRGAGTTGSGGGTAASSGGVDEEASGGAAGSCACTHDRGASAWAVVVLGLGATLRRRKTLRR